MDLLDALLDTLALSVGIRTRTRRAEDLWARTGQVRSAVRLVSGQEDGVSEGWERALVKVSYGQLTVAGRVIDVAALATTTSAAARAEKRRVAADGVLVQVATSSDARLDWVLSAAMVPQVRSRLAR